MLWVSFVSSVHNNCHSNHANGIPINNSKKYYSFGHSPKLHIQIGIKIKCKNKHNTIISITVLGPCGWLFPCIPWLINHLSCYILQRHSILPKCKVVSIRPKLYSKNSNFQTMLSKNPSALDAYYYNLFLYNSNAYPLS